MIQPVMTPEEWARALRFPGGLAQYDDAVGEDAKTCAYIIAMNNAALPDDDPRKITPELVDMVRTASAIWEGEYTAGPGGDITEVNALRIFADALESYLPPLENAG